MRQPSTCQVDTREISVDSIRERGSHHEWTTQVAQKGQPQIVNWNYTCTEEDPNEKPVTAFASTITRVTEMKSATKKTEEPVLLNDEWEQKAE